MDIVVFIVGFNELTTLHYVTLTLLGSFIRGNVEKSIHLSLPTCLSIKVENTVESNGNVIQLKCNTIQYTRQYNANVFVFKTFFSLHHTKYIKASQIFRFV